ncbi:MAG: ABC transporter ATP-binding protein [Pedosphaera sp.]|nr:ABC transporter ATP-binding protein [Pedosphaera sp.]
MAQLELDQVSRWHPAASGGVQALHNVSLNIRSGECLVVVGPSGSGKTSLLRLIAGLDNLTAGDIRLNGRSLRGVPPAGRDLSLVFQNLALYPHMTVRENVVFGLEIRRMSAPEIAGRLEPLIARFRLEQLLDRRPGEISGGERQRVALARALAANPRILLLDEPFTSLETPLRLEFRRDLRRLQQESGLTVIHVTHDPMEAMALADRIAVLRAGELIQLGAPDEIYGDPADRFVAELFGQQGMNLFSGNLRPHTDGVRFESVSGEIRWVAPGMAVRTHVDAGVRPEDIFVLESGEAGFSAGVLAVERAGHDTWIVAQVSGRRVTVRVPPRSLLQPGSQVLLTVDSARVRYFDGGTGKRITL